MARWPIGWHGRWTQWPAPTRLAKSSLSFIDGTTELLAGLAAGARTVLADDDAARDGRRLAELIAAHDVASWWRCRRWRAALADEHPGEVGAADTGGSSAASR